MTSLKRLAVLCAGVALLASASAEATPIVIVPGAGLASNAPALAAWNRAANAWGNILTDPITVTVNADMFNMGSPSILGATSAVFLGAGYNTIRNQMVVDAGNEPDDAIVASLPTAAQFGA